MAIYRCNTCFKFITLDNECAFVPFTGEVMCGICRASESPGDKAFRLSVLKEKIRAHKAFEEVVAQSLNSRDGSYRP